MTVKCNRPVPDSFGLCVNCGEPTFRRSNGNRMVHMADVAFPPEAVSLEEHREAARSKRAQVRAATRSA